MEENMLPEGLTYWDVVSEKSMDLAISQSETLLKETISTAQSIQDKSDRLTSVLVPLFSGILVYIITYTGNYNDTIVLTSIFSLGDIAIVLYYLYGNLIPYKINVAGANASEFLNDQVIKHDDTKNQYLKIGMMVCNNIKIRVDRNIKTNDVRSNRVKSAVNVLFIGLPACPILGYLLHLLCVRYF